MKPEWDKWRADTAMYVKNLTAARSAVTAATGPAEASLTQPGQPKFDVNAFDGDMVTKDVAIKAQVKSPEGQTSEKDLVITACRKVVGQPQGGTRRAKAEVDHHEDRGPVASHLAPGAAGARPALHARSSFANFARSVFWPTEMNRTTSFWSSSSASTLSTVPTPNCAVLHPRAGPQAAGAGLVLVLVHERRRFLAARGPAVAWRGPRRTGWPDTPIRRACAR